MGKKTVLVVDDDYDLREAVAIALEAEDYRVLTATNGKTAFEVLEREGPESLSSIVLDLMMPEMDGREFLRRLREEYPAYAGVPVIVATAMGASAEKIALPYPVARIPKPMDLDALYRVLAENSASPRDSNP